MCDVPAQQLIDIDLNIPLETGGDEDDLVHHFEVADVQHIIFLEILDVILTDSGEDLVVLDSNQ